MRVGAPVAPPNGALIDSMLSVAISLNYLKYLSRSGYIKGRALVICTH